MKLDKEELTIYEVEDLHKELAIEIQKGDIVLDMEQVNKIDMSVVQLLISTKKTAFKNETQFELHNVSDELKDFFNNSSCSFLLGS